MGIVYAAEKTSISALLGEHLKRRVAPGEIRISENPDETGRILECLIEPSGSGRA